MERIIKFFKKWDQIWVIIMAIIGLSILSAFIIAGVSYIIKLIN
jgi:Na+-transporting NADH:ubiquinone oxidoreductase subunit NqrC